MSEDRPVLGRRSTGGRQASALVADGHVHLHACFDIEHSLDSAAASFESFARQAGYVSWTGFLLLAEGAHERTFEKLKARSDCTVGLWACQGTAEVECLRLVRSDGIELFLVGGRQITTREGLEVLALGTTRRIPDGLPIWEVVEQCHLHGAVPVIPWAFGKWWFERGRVVRKLLQKESGHRILLGDNGGRPRLTWRPRLFRLASRCGVQVLPGTDPLPFASEAGRVGSYCFVLSNWVKSQRPTADLKSRLLHLQEAPGVHGHRSSLLRFALMLIRLQFRRTFRRRLSIRAS